MKIKKKCRRNGRIFCVEHKLRIKFFRRLLPCIENLRHRKLSIRVYSELLSIEKFKFVNPYEYEVLWTHRKLLSIISRDLGIT